MRRNDTRYDMAIDTRYDVAIDTRYDMAIDTRYGFYGLFSGQNLKVTPMAISRQ